ncbi:MAG: 4-alpha-glucanotransferase, partial [Clostridiales bacterium]|nr:4-alpha-glucanotransferase [Clostridiales bacterium]
MRRGSGVLLHISSLPGPYGVGCFGREVLDFARILSEAGVSYWQVLPFSVPGEGDSPYMSVSAFAGNPMWIDPEELVDRG